MDTKSEDKYVCSACGKEVSPFDGDHYEVCEPKDTKSETTLKYWEKCPYRDIYKLRLSYGYEIMEDVFNSKDADMNYITVHALKSFRADIDKRIEEIPL